MFHSDPPRAVSEHTSDPLCQTENTLVFLGSFCQLELTPCRLLAQYDLARSKARLTPPRLKHVRRSARLVDRPVAPRQIPEVLERVIERVVHGVDQEQPEAGDWASEGIVILLAIDGVNHAGQVVMAQLDQVGAHPPDLSAVLGEREDVQELMLHGCGLPYRVQLPELGALGGLDKLFKKSGDLHGWRDDVEVHPVWRRVTKTVSALLPLLCQLFRRFLPPLHERPRRLRLRRVSREQVVHAFDLG